MLFKNPGDGTSHEQILQHILVVPAFCCCDFQPYQDYLCRKHFDFPKAQFFCQEELAFFLAGDSSLSCTFQVLMAFQLSWNFIGIFLEPRIPKIYRFWPLLMALGIVRIRFGIKMEFNGKLYDGCTKSYGGGEFWEKKEKMTMTTIIFLNICWLSKK